MFNAKSCVVLSVVYAGIPFNVPVQANYIATDEDGTLRWWVIKPNLPEMDLDVDPEFYGRWWGDVGDIYEGGFLGTLKFDGDWRDSMLCIDKPLKILQFTQNERNRIEVDCFGITFSIPNTVKWLAVDEDGTLKGYMSEPTLHMDHFERDIHSNEIFLGKVEYEGNWQKSLTRIINV